ncbi:head GIN domain-containing protein [Croceimicrobium sp.]|uniref:head GIN domain-containing protein n=1 Tax=Croceimicrobium sp. TaxID=2828340 RepID=UPI003BAA523A
MKSILSFIAVLALTTSCMVGVTGSGKVIEENRNVEEFDGIDASGMFEIHLVQADVHRLKVVADDNLMDLIETYVEGGVLHIRSRKSIGKAKELDVYISSPDYESIQLSGAVTIDNKGTLDVNDLDIESSGAAQITLSVDADDIKLELSGATELNMSGTADKVSIEGSGASECKMFDLNCRKMRIDVSGASELEVNVSEELEIEASGASDIRYRGNGRIVRQNLSGASNVVKD